MARWLGGSVARWLGGSVARWLSSKSVGLSTKKPGSNQVRSLYIAHCMSAVGMSTYMGE